MSGAQDDGYGNLNYTYSQSAWLWDPETRAMTPTGNMTTPRGFHHAVKLADGRVLIAGGSAQWSDPWSFWTRKQGNPDSPVLWAENLPFAEIYDPATGAFSPLPQGSHSTPSTAWIPTSISGAGMMWSNHPWGDSLLMSNGKVLFVGGDHHGWWSNMLGMASHNYGNAPGAIEGADVYDPAAQTFDLSDAPWRYGLGKVLGDWQVGAGTTPRMASLADGRVLLNYGHLTNEGMGTTELDGKPIMPTNKPLLIDPATLQTTETGPMQLSRFGHTLTRLPDGRILAVGGRDYTQANYAGGTSERWHFQTTATAEIYDPVTNAWTPTAGSLSQARGYHAAILLPTGQVLIVGGVQTDLEGGLRYPNQVEVFDPSSGTFTTMDHLDYGLSEPKAVLLNDGSVFLAGQMQAPMEQPYAAANNRGQGMMEASPNGLALAAGSSLFGTLAPSTMGWMTEVQWGSGIPVSLGQQTVPLPHWKFGVGVEDGQGSKRPAVYSCGPYLNALQVKLRLFKGMFTHGSGKLIGTLAPAQLGGGGAPLGQLQMEGDFTLNDGEQTVSLQITNMPSAVNWYRGDVAWKVQTPQGTVDLQGTTRLEMFVVLNKPTSIYNDTGGVWAEVLRFLGENANVLGATTESRVLEQVTSYLHWNHGLTYETGQGATKFGKIFEFDGTGGVFRLMAYLSPPAPPNNQANCYDQAAGVQSLAGALGVSCDWVYLAPYGYINETHLLGVSGVCNNPFFTALDVPGYHRDATPQSITWNDMGRTGFGNHAFIRANGFVFDACAEPHLGTETLDHYILKAIDARPELYGKPGRPQAPGTLANTNPPYRGVIGVVAE